MIMKDRLQKIIISEGLTPAILADEIGVQRSGISHILSGRNNPSYDFLQKILIRFPKLNAEWLLLGQGSMYKHPLQTQAEHPVAEPANDPIPPPILPFDDRKPKKTTYSSSKNIEKIVIFYADQTFKDYSPNGTPS